MENPERSLLNQLFLVLWYDKVLVSEINYSINFTSEKNFNKLKSVDPRQGLPPLSLSGIGLK